MPASSCRVQWTILPFNCSKALELCDENIGVNIVDDLVEQKVGVTTNSLLLFILYFINYTNT